MGDPSGSSHASLCPGLPDCPVYRCEGTMALKAFKHPPDYLTALHQRECGVCGRIATYFPYEVGTVVDKGRIRSLETHVLRMIKALME